MMKDKRGFGKRLCSLALTGCMLLGLVPVSALMVLAAEDAPVSLRWEPQEQSEAGTRDVELAAQLKQTDGGHAAAMLEIALDADEAAALQWEKETVEEDALGEETGGEDTGDSTDSTDDGDQPKEPGDPAGSTDDGEQSKEPGEPAGGATGPQAVLITGVDGGGAVLRILLVGGSPYEETLTFSSSTSTSVSVEDNDIRVQTYEAGSTPDISTALLLGGDAGNKDAEITTDSFPIFADLPRRSRSARREKASAWTMKPRVARSPMKSASKSPPPQKMKRDIPLQ